MSTRASWTARFTKSQSSRDGISSDLTLPRRACKLGEHSPAPAPARPTPRAAVRRRTVDPAPSVLRPAYGERRARALGGCDRQPGPERHGSGLVDRRQFDRATIGRQTLKAIVRTARAKAEIGVTRSLDSTGLTLPSVGTYKRGPRRAQVANACPAQPARPPGSGCGARGTPMGGGSRER